MHAHERLLARAQREDIKVYFLGDSITRRWAAEEPEYAEFLAHWNATFSRLKAGNFGWGGDTTRNILWRITNGELDGVDPDTIVLLAGTNDVGGGAGAAEVAAGIEAIVRVCRSKAPMAKVVLMAIFERTDHAEYLPVIREANRLIAGLGDVFLDINPQLLAVEGIFPDGLHLSLRAYEIWAETLIPHLSKAR